MTYHSAKGKRLAEQCCRTNGYLPCGANWYRCHGQGLLQVVSFNGLRGPRDKACVAVGFYSLYEKILWVNFSYMGAQRDLVPNIAPSDLLNAYDSSLPTDGVNDLHLMQEHGFSILNAVNTHEQLAQLFENLDMHRGQRIILNASNKMVAYLLSGQSEKAIAAIDAIETHNRNACAQNCVTMAEEDREPYRQKLENHLAPYLLLRAQIRSAQWPAIAASLLENYRANTARLADMGISIVADELDQHELIRLLTSQV